MRQDKKKRFLLLFIGKEEKKRNASIKNNGDLESKEIFHSISYRSR